MIAMNRRVAIFGGLVALALMPGYASARSSQRHQCPRTNVVLIVANRHGEIYERSEQTAPHAPPSQDGIFGCAFSRGRSYLLGPLSAESSMSFVATRHVTLAGQMTAVTRAQGGEGSGGQEIKVRSLASGKLVSRLLPVPGGEGTAETLVLSEAGTVAWIAGTPPAMGGHRVYYAQGNTVHLVAEGPTIVPDSLALAGKTLYWTAGGVANETQLP
jgi:hypothetical protein